MCSVKRMKNLLSFVISYLEKVIIKFQGKSLINAIVSLVLKGLSRVPLVYLFFMMHF